MPQLRTFAPWNLYSHFRLALAENHAQDAHILNTHRIPDEHNPAASCPRLPTVPQKQCSILRSVGYEGSATCDGAHIEAYAPRGWLPCQLATACVVFVDNIHLDRRKR